jgi:hypothetical protein
MPTVPAATTVGLYCMHVSAKHVTQVVPGEYADLLPPKQATAREYNNLLRSCRRRIAWEVRTYVRPSECTTSIRHVARSPK